MYIPILYIVRELRLFYLSQVPERLTYDVRTRCHFEISQLFVHTPVCGCRAVGLAAAHYNWIREP